MMLYIYNAIYMCVCVCVYTHVYIYNAVFVSLQRTLIWSPSSDVKCLGRQNEVDEETWAWTGQVTSQALC